MASLPHPVSANLSLDRLSAYLASPIDPELPLGIKVAEEAIRKAGQMFLVKANDPNRDPTKALKLKASSGILPMINGQVLLALVHKAEADDPAHGTYSTLAGGVDLEDCFFPELPGRSEFEAPACVVAAAREAEEESHGFFQQADTQKAILSGKATLLPNGGMKREGDGFFAAPIFAVPLNHLTPERNLETLLAWMNGAAEAAARRNPDEEVRGFALVRISAILQEQMRIEAETKARKQTLQAQHPEEAAFKEACKKDEVLRALNIEPARVKLEGTDTVIKVNAATRRTFAESMDFFRGILQRDA